MQTVKAALRRLVTGVDERGINVRLLKKVARYIRNNPEHYSQSTWFTFRDDDGVVRRDTLTPAEVQQQLIPGNGPKCGTVACVAGTALWMSRRFNEYLLDTFETGSRRAECVDWRAGAQDVLGLSDETGEWLFSAVRDEESMPQLLEAIARGHSVELDALYRLENEVLAERGLVRNSYSEEIEELCSRA